MKIDPNAPDFDPTPLKQEGESSFARQMLAIYRAFNALAQKKYQEKGYRGLTPVHTSLVANTDLEGTRIVTIAERMGTTKQFTGRIVQELEQRGYLSTQPDPGDRRATLVKINAKGWQFLADACEARREIEETFKAALGEELMSAFVRAIDALSKLDVDIAETPEPLELLRGD
jgi:DNA-binding MarR family transcriptional regulator